MPDRFLEHFGWVRRTFRMTPEERIDTRAPVPVWWPMPTENTIDRATTVLPGLLYDRMDEIGLDFSIVYPGTGLLVVTLPGMADEELRRSAAARAYNLYNAEMFAAVRGPADARRGDPDAHTGGGDRGARLSRSATLGLKVALLAGDVLRPVPAIQREHPDLERQVFYQDCFGIDSPYDYDPVWQRCLDLRCRADVSLGADRVGDARVDLAPPVQPARRVRRGRRGARPSRCSSGVSRTASRR